VYQKQTRKGKDIPYITHPLTVGLILSLAGGSEDIIIAGILHDTIEDSTAEKKVTPEMLTERFGQNVSNLVLSVTEQNKALPWEERKKEALKHIKTFSYDSLLVKSADTIGNVSELLDDYERDGGKTLTRFNAPEKMIKNYLEVIRAILGCWSESPLASELESIKTGLENMENSQQKTVQPSGDEFVKLGEIAKRFWERGISANPPKFVVFMGGVGSGKTTIRREKFSEGYVNFDAGEINNYSEKEFGKDNPKLESLTTWVCGTILEKSINERKNIVIEIIGDSKEVITPVIDKMIEIGYKVELIPVYCGVEVAYVRHLNAVKEDKEYLSSYFTQEATLYFFYQLLQLGKMRP